MSCGVGHRCGLDLVWLWLWRRPAATALIQLLAWKPPYAKSVALKRPKQTKKKKKKKKKERKKRKDKKKKEVKAQAANLGLSSCCITT